MAGIKPENYQAYMRGDMTREQAEGTALNQAYQSGGLSALAQAGQKSSYTSPAVSNTKTTTPSYTAPATSYTGSANQIGNVSGSTDLAKSYQDLYNSTRNDTNQYSQQNTWGDSKGNVYDTTSMTPQQIFALSLAKDGNPNAAAILKGMGLDMNGNATSPTPTYSGSNTSSATQKPTYQTGTLTPTSSNAADYAAGGKYASYNVNDKAFQDKTEEEKKSIFAANPTLAAQEIQRAKQVWADNPNDPEKQRLAHAWADKVRSWSGLPADGEEESTPSGGSVDPNAGAGQDPNAIDWSDPNAVLGLIGKSIGQTTGAMNDPNSAYWAGQQAASDLEQTGIYNTKMSQYQQLINNLKTGQQNDLKVITDGVDSATNKIEDKSFQDWLAARQNAASRGLAGSGLASDMNTRLLLSKQRDLADMFTGKNAQMADVNKRYSDQISTAQSGIANTNLNAMQVAAFQKLFKDGQGSLNDQLKVFADLFNNASKNNITSEGDKLKATVDMYKTNAEYKFKYDNMNATSKTDADKLTLEWAKHGLDVTQAMGVDANGNMTLDSKKLMQQIKEHGDDLTFKYDDLGAQVIQWSSQNKLKQSDLDLGHAQLSEKTQYDKAMIEKASQSSQNDVTKMAVDALKTKAQTLTDQITAKSKNGKLKEDDPLIKDYNDVMDQVSGIISNAGK